MTDHDRSTNEELRERSVQDWSNSVATKGRWNHKATVMGRTITQALITEAQIKPGMHVLDLASGTGDPALTLATLVAPGGAVTATDLVPEMLDVGEVLVAKVGSTNITFRQASAEALPFPDHSFDAVTYRLGVMLFVDVPRGVAEIFRMPKSGGRAAFVAQGRSEHNPWQECLLRVFREYLDIRAPDPETPHPHRFARSGTLTTALHTAGFSPRRVAYSFLS